MHHGHSHGSGDHGHSHAPQAHGQNHSHGFPHQQQQQQIGSSSNVIRVNESNADAPPPNSVPLTPYQMAQRGMTSALESACDQGFDVGQSDAEGITCLHWSAINNAIETTRFILSRGVDVDPVGGDLKATPLHWALRQGHLEMVVFLVKHGAKHNVVDAQGHKPLHIAAQLGFMNIAAFLIASGSDVNMIDKNERTPLMWAATRSFSSEMTRCLIALDATLNVQDIFGCTALHYAIASSNLFAVRALVDAGAATSIVSKHGLTPQEMVYLPPDLPPGASWQPNTHMMKMIPNEKTQKWLDRWQRFHTDPGRRTGILLLPLLGLCGLGYSFEYMKLSVLIGILFAVLTIATWAAAVRFFSFSYEKQGESPTPMGVYIGTKAILYGTFFYYLWGDTIDESGTPLIPWWSKVALLFITYLLVRSFWKSHRMDPGYIPINRKDRNAVIIELAEKNQLDSQHFCPTCAIRKPLRSKHCSICNRCVAKFDHHCPFVDNAVGANNHHHFITFLVTFLAASVIFINYGIRWLHAHSGSGNDSDHDSFFAEVGGWFVYSPWMCFCIIMNSFHFIWVVFLCVMQLQQLLLHGLTTNEEINHWRYKYLEGRKTSPWSKGIIGNLVELYFPKTDWSKVFLTPDEMEFGIKDVV
eukprot:m.3822 g.3822  ORF g.3822 m.3822 type:complete len:641 (-) comp3743_c0_seq2:2318-4240(-)